MITEFYTIKIDTINLCFPYYVDNNTFIEIIAKNILCHYGIH